jgi:hypothetical protein
VLNRSQRGGLPHLGQDVEHVVGVEILDGPQVGGLQQGQHHADVGHGATDVVRGVPLAGQRPTEAVEVLVERRLPVSGERIGEAESPLVLPLASLLGQHAAGLALLLAQALQVFAVGVLPTTPPCLRFRFDFDRTGRGLRDVASVRGPRLPVQHVPDDLRRYRVPIGDAPS